MTIRWRKVFTVGRNLHLILNKNSAAFSVGRRGAHVGYNTRRGAYASASAPGTGLYVQQYFRRKARTKATATARSTAAAKPTAARRRPLIGRGTIVFLFGATWLITWSLIQGHC